MGALAPFFHDVTTGNNAYGGVAGYDATPGWDPATGWGTPALADLGKLLSEMPDED